MATRVTLREKPMTNGRKSLYLDFYPAIINSNTGKETRREFLRMFVYEKARTQAEKVHNSETLSICANIRQKRENELNKPEIYTEFEREQLKIKALGEMDFIEYFEKLANKRKASNHDNWMSALNYLREFGKDGIKMNQITIPLLDGFKEYLLTTKSIKSEKVKLSQNSAVSYFNKVKATLKQAYKDGFLQENINERVPPIKTEETRREFLTIEELNTLVQTPCNDVVLKRAALFSALTGLRFSDIKKLTWKEVTYIENQGYFLNFKQQKTKGVEAHPISEQAYSLALDDRTREDLNEDTQVFDGLVYSAYVNKHFAQWMGAAGITRNITFHSMRHTFATLQLFSGTDIYTVSKMLGHKELKTTQVYAKIVDDTKRIAADKIKLNLF